MKAKYNKSEIMKSAYRIYRNSWCTMGQALKEAWRRAKAELVEREAREKKKETCIATDKDRKNAYDYRNVIFGKMTGLSIMGKDISN